MHFFTTVNAGIKLNKWSFIGNVPIDLKIREKIHYRWRDTELNNWYSLKFEEKIKLGSNLSPTEMKIPVVCFQFPVLPHNTFS